MRERLPGASVVGNPDRRIRAIGALSSRAAGVLAFRDAARAGDRLAGSAAAIVIVPKSIGARPNDDSALIAVDDVRAAFIDIAEALLPGAARPFDPAAGVHPSARVDACEQRNPCALVDADIRASAEGCSRTRQSATT